MRIRCYFGPWIRIRDPGKKWKTSQIIFRELRKLETVLGLKILKFFDADPGFGIYLTLDPGSSMAKFGYGINNPDPQTVNTLIPPKNKSNEEWVQDDRSCRVDSPLTSVADPDLESSAWFLTPGSAMMFLVFDPWIQVPEWKKIRIRNPGSSITIL